MAFLSRAADEFQRALESPRPVPAGVADLVATARAVGALATCCAPDEQFVADLGRRLRAEAAALPTRRPVAAPTRGTVGPSGQAPAAPGGSRGAAKGAPVVILLGRGLPRALAGAVASAVLVLAVVGVASRSALPGQALYPVRQLIDQVAVGLAGSDYDKGRTLLAQAQDHLGDAVRLVDSRAAGAGQVDTALSGAARSVIEARLQLRADFTATRNPRSPLALEDFTRRSAPLLDGLRGRAPAASLPLLDQLRSLVAETSADALQQLADCADCGAAAEAARQALQASQTSGPGALTGRPGGVPGAPAGPGTGPSSGLGTGAAVSGGAGTGPAGAATSGPGVPLVSVPTTGANGPSAQEPVPTPGSVSVPVPGATVGPGGDMQSSGASLSPPPVSPPPVSPPPVSPPPVNTPPVNIPPVDIPPPVNIPPVDIPPAVPLPTLPTGNSASRTCLLGVCP